MNLFKTEVLYGKISIVTNNKKSLRYWILQKNVLEQFPVYVEDAKTIGNVKFLDITS